jgi:hypothetical protein
VINVVFLPIVINVHDDVWTSLALRNFACQPSAIFSGLAGPDPTSPEKFNQNNNPQHDLTVINPTQLLLIVTPYRRLLFMIS